MKSLIFKTYDLIRLLAILFGSNLAVHADVRFDSKCQIEVGSGQLVKPKNIGGEHKRKSYYIKRTEDLNGYPLYEINLRTHYISKTLKMVDLLKFREYVNSCLNSYDKLLSHSNGSKLRIKHLDKSSFSEHKKIETSVIEVTDGDGSGDSIYRLETGSDCSTILHETLHLLGLVDEYEDKNLLGIQNEQFSCRAIGRFDSIMNQEKIAVASLIGGCISEEKTLYCMDKSDEPSNLDIYKLLNSITSMNEFLPPRGCELQEKIILRGNEVANVQSNGRCPDPSIEADIRRDQEGFDQIVPAIRIWNKKSAWRTSLLTDGQFNRIVFPNCVKLNINYNQCATYSYIKTRTSECNIKNIPPICSSTLWAD